MTKRSHRSTQCKRLKKLQEKRIELAAEANDLEARLKAIRHQLVDVCDEIEQFKAKHGAR